MSKTMQLLGIMLILITSVNYASSSNDQSASNKASSKSSAHSLWLVNNLPRYKGQDELTKEELDIMTEDTGNSDWLKGIIGYAVVCAIVPILSLVCSQTILL